MPETLSYSSKLILHVFPGFAIGGAQMRFASIANHYGRHFRHCVISLNGNLDCATRMRSHLDISYPALITSGLTFSQRIRLFRDTIRDLSPDTVVTSNWGAIEFAMAASFGRHRHIHMEDGFGPDEATRQIRRRVLTRMAVLRRCTVAVPSTTLACLARDVWRLPKRNVCLIPNGVDTERFHPCVLPSSPSRDRTMVIGTVATLRAEKNIPRLLEAFALMRQAHDVSLRIAGDGPDKAALESMAQAMGLGGCVKFAGHLQQPADFYRKLDIFVLTSDTEQMPLSVLEAMASGLPVVSTEVGDVANMVSPVNRPLICTKDAQDVARLTGTLLDDAELRRYLGLANREKAVSTFSQNQMFSVHAALWEG